MARDCGRCRHGGAAAASTHSTAREIPTIGSRSSGRSALAGIVAAETVPEKLTQTFESAKSKRDGDRITGGARYPVDIEASKPWMS